MSQAPDAPYYRYDAKLGNPRDAFIPAAEARPDVGRPEIPATFVARVEGEQMIGSMWGSRVVPWRAEPGTPCVILGYWADGTLQLRWPAIAGNYRVEGRFPAWVVAEDLNAAMAGGGRLLRANNPVEHPSLRKRFRSFLLNVFRD
jgi:hypothetical protein